MTELTKDTKILIVGLGVMGGGYAKALTAAVAANPQALTSG